MKKTIALIALVGVFGAFFFFAGCEQGKEGRYTPSFRKGEEKELIVGIHPYLNAQKTFVAFNPILDHLEKNLPGVRLRLETSANYADYERKLFSGYFDLSLPNSYQTLKAIDAGYRVVAKVKPDSDFRGLIVARKALRLRSVAQLRGKAVSFPAPTALAATMMPKWFLYEKGLNVEKEAFPRYVGSQYSSIMNAYTGDTAAAATWPAPWKTWCAENPEKAEEMEVVWETPALVNNAFVVRNDVDRETAEKIVALLCALDTTPQGRELLYASGFKGFERSDDSAYLPVKRFLRLYDEAIGLPE